MDHHGADRNGVSRCVSSWSMLRCSVMVATNKKFVRECLESEFRIPVRESKRTCIGRCTSSAVDGAQQSSMWSENTRVQNTAIRHSELLWRSSCKLRYYYVLVLHLQFHSIQFNLLSYKCVICLISFLALMHLTSFTLIYLLTSCSFLKIVSFL